MKKNKFLIASVFITIGLLFGYFSWNYFVSKNGSVKIENFQFDKDASAVDSLFHKGDNWYWMISTDSTSSYSVDFMLRYKTSSQSEKLSNMILKVAKIDNQVAGFLGYYQKSAHVWHLLFLIVDQDFRRKGVARSLLKYAVSDMVARGALRVDLATRNNNFRAQGLYKSFGFRLTDSDDEFVHFSWYKK